ncbi:hypothetical protein, partial [Bacillus anthracis]|uniref:hypothetical protein n=1 Tax=Bacillus anthracis TaxID=1392 RepID=UPI0039A58A0E
TLLRDCFMALGGDGGEEFGEETALKTRYFLEGHASPVASDADLRAENERLRKALAEAERLAQAGLCYFRLDNVRAYHEDIRRTVTAALNPSEPRT